MGNGHTGLARWHDYMTSGADPAVLADLLADDAVFHSPVVHTPQVGKAVVMAYLVAAAHVLGGENFRYVRELVDGDEMMLEFVTEIDGVIINGVDIIHWNEDRKIRDFKVMVRPLKAINKVWEMMGAQLAATKRIA
jgi:SnoaL-like domain